MATNNSKTAIFYGIMNQRGLLSDFLKFAHIKYRKNVDVGERIYYDANKKKHKVILRCDRSGGSFKKTEIKDIASELNIKKETLQKRIDHMVELGWLKPTLTAYRLVPMKKLFSFYAPDLGIKKLSFRHTDKTEIMRMAAFFYIKTNLVQQLYRQRGCPIRLPKYSAALLMDEQFSMSVRTLQKVLGYGSPMSACSRLLELEEKKWITIKRRERLIGRKEELKFLIEGNPDLSQRFFIVDDNVYERLCNNIYFNKKDAA